AEDPVASVLAALPARVRDWRPLARAQYLEMQTLLAGYLLSAQGDRMLMGNSVEGRFPFLDHRLVEFAAALPEPLKLRGLAEKWILRRYAARWVPEAILRRQKFPYRAPIAAALTGAQAPAWARELLSRDAVRGVGGRQSGGAPFLREPGRAHARARSPSRRRRRTPGGSRLDRAPQPAGHGGRGPRRAFTGRVRGGDEPAVGRRRIQGGRGADARASRLRAGPGRAKLGRGSALAAAPLLGRARRRAERGTARGPGWQGRADPRGRAGRPGARHGPGDGGAGKAPRLPRTRPLHLRLDRKAARRRPDLRQHRRQHAFDRAVPRARRDRPGHAHPAALVLLRPQRAADPSLRGRVGVPRQPLHVPARRPRGHGQRGL